MDYPIYKLTQKQYTKDKDNDDVTYYALVPTFISLAEPNRLSWLPVLTMSLGGVLQTTNNIVYHVEDVEAIIKAWNPTGRI